METQTGSGRTQGQHLAKMEHKRFYASNQAAIAALELTTALATVLTRRLGQDFADELCAELRQRALDLQTDDFTEQCTASIVGELAEWPSGSPSTKSARLNRRPNTPGIDTPIASPKGSGICGAAPIHLGPHAASSTASA